LFPTEERGDSTDHNVPSACPTETASSALSRSLSKEKLDSRLPSVIHHTATRMSRDLIVPSMKSSRGR